MLKRLLRLIQQAIDKMLGYTSISKAIDINGMTILSIPDFSGNVNSQNTKVTLEVSNGGGAFTQDNIFIASGYAPVSVSGNRNLYTGQMTVNTFNGKLFFSNTSWAGRVVSYTDSRII